MNTSALDGELGALLAIVEALGLRIGSSLDPTLPRTARRPLLPFLYGAGLGGGRTNSTSSL